MHVYFYQTILFSINSTRDNCFPFLGKHFFYIFPSGLKRKKCGKNQDHNMSLTVHILSFVIKILLQYSTKLFARMSNMISLI